MMINPELYLGYMYNYIYNMPISSERVKDTRVQK